LIQTSISLDLDLNLKRATEMVKVAAGRGAKIVCLPELYRTRYFPQWEKRDVSSLAETIPGESTRAFSALAREYEIVIIVPLFEKDEQNYYNSLAVIDADGSLQKTYRKVHLPHDPLFYEKSYFSPGDEFQVYDTRYARFAALICYDQWFPEAPARLACRAQRSSSIPRPSAGSREQRALRKATGMMHGRRSSAAMPLLMVFMWRL